MPEIDKIFRKVRRQGGRIIERGRGHGWTVVGPRGKTGVQSSRLGRGQVRGLRYRLRGIGFDV